MTRHSLLFFAALVALSPAIFAQEKKAEEKPASVLSQKEVVQKKMAENAPLKKWVDAENALIDPLSDADKESFFILRNKHSVIRVIRIVERDIGNAVKACGDKNPDMADKMNTRFKQWQGAVDPILDTAKKQLDKDLNTQKIVDTKKAREVLKLNDEAYEYGDKQVIKTPVTTKEACQGLLDSMDRTEDQMITLLQQTLLPESVIKKRGEDIDKARAEAAKNQPKESKPAAAPDKKAE